jgi:hypothetical protein
VRFIAKILVFLIFNILLFNVTYLRHNQKGDHSIVRQALAKPEYRYWDKVDGISYCKAVGDEKTELFKSFDGFTMKKTNVVYLINTDVLSCQYNLPEIARELHMRDLELAIDLDLSLDYKLLYSEDFAQFTPANYSKRFEGAKGLNGWVDYIVVDNAMEFMTYDERRGLQSELRAVFPKPFLGFRFTKHFNFPFDTIHPNRQDKRIGEFLPKEDDGDFIITSINPELFKRTYVFIEDKDFESLQFDGEFL